MPDRLEILQSLQGAWRLARLDRAGMTFFNLTVAGFWRSFFAAVLVAPGYAILIAQKLAEREAVAPEVAPSVVATGEPAMIWAVVVQAVTYVLSWAAFPIVAALLTWLLNLGRAYVALIVAGNWASVIQMAAFLAALLLGYVLPAALAPILITVVTGGILFYQWFVIRTALQTSGGVALAFVLVDLLVNTMINVGADRLV
jgi:hypothetical protein